MPCRGKCWILLDSPGRPLSPRQAAFFPATSEVWNSHLSCVSISEPPLTATAPHTCGKRQWRFGSSLQLLSETSHCKSKTSPLATESHKPKNHLADCWKKLGKGLTISSVRLLLKWSSVLSVLQDGNSDLRGHCKRHLLLPYLRQLASTFPLPVLFSSAALC